MALKTDELCADCAGYDYEWMRTCPKHKGVQFCRGCSCPYCAEEVEEDYDYEPSSDSQDVPGAI